MNPHSHQKIKNGFILGGISFLCVLAGVAFFLQLRNQFRSKAREIRSTLIRLERLPTGELVICNLDKKVGLLQLALKAQTDTEFTQIQDLGGLAPDACGLSRQFPKEVIEFKALWASESPELSEAILIYPKKLHDFQSAPLMR